MFIKLYSKTCNKFLILLNKDKKKPQQFAEALNLDLAVPTLPVRLQTSTIGAVDLTAVFEMGTGVSLQLFPPGNFKSKIKLILCPYS